MKFSAWVLVMFMASVSHVDTSFQADRATEIAQLSLDVVPESARYNAKR